MKEFIRTLRTLLGFFTKKRGWYVLFVVTIIIAAFVRSTIPYILKLLVDAIPLGNYNLLFNILLILIFVRFAQLLLDVSSHFLGDINLVDSSADTRSTIFKHLQDLDFAYHTSKSTGSLISAMKRGDGAYFHLEYVIHFRIIPVVISFLVLMYFFTGLDKSIAYVGGVSFFMTLIVAAVIVRYNIESRKKFVHEDDEISGIIVDNLVNYDTVKYFAKEGWEYKRLLKAFIPWKKYFWKYANSFRLIDLCVGTVINISIFLLFYLGIKGIITNRFTVGDFVLIASFISTFYPQVWDLVYGFREMAKNYADIQGYFKILDNKIEVVDPKEPVTIDKLAGEVKFDRVSFAYQGIKKNAIKDITLSVRQGQSVALVGRSGSGKTTLIKLLLRFFDVSKGKITIDDIDLRNMNKSHLRSFIGVVPQEPVMFNNTIGYNIAYGKKFATKEEISAAAKMANLHSFIMSLPKGYETNVGERGVKLSGGQKQRLAIARMFLSDPEIIIFDEATSQLDSENEKLIQDAFWKVAHNKTTIIIAHRLSTALRADKIVVMNKGKIIEEGSHRELTEQKGLYAYFWDLQTSGNDNLPRQQS